MKKIFLLNILLVFLFLLNGCKKEEMIGVWAPIKVDKDSFTIPAAGGEAIANMKNYEHWYVADIKIIIDNVEEHLCDYDNNKPILENEWLKVSVPQDNTKQVIIKLQPNLGEMRIVQVRMTVGDAFHTIEIKQEKGS